MSRSKSEERHPWQGRTYWVLAACILILATTLRLIALDKGLRLDEFSSLQVTSGADWLNKLRLYDHPPLYFLLLKLVRTVSDQIPFLRLIAVCAGVGMVGIVLGWLRPYSARGSLLAGLLVATHPALVHFSQEIRHYGLLLFLVSLAFLLADRLASRGGVWWSLGLGLTLTAAIATHLVAVFMWTAVLLFLAVVWWRKRTFPLRALILPTLLPALLVLVIATSVFNAVGVKHKRWWMSPPDSALMTKLGETYLGDGATRWAAASTKKKAPNLETLPLMAIAAAVLLLVGVPFRHRPTTRSVALLLAAAAFGLQMLTISVLLVPILVPRTGLPLLIPLIGCFGMQIRRIDSTWVRGLTASAVIALATLWGFWWAAVQGPRPFGPWKAVAGHLEERWRPGDVMLFCPLYVKDPLTFYAPTFDTSTSLAFGLRWEHEKIEQHLDATLAQRTPDFGGNYLWLVLRRDPSIKARKDRYFDLLAALEDRLGNWQTQKTFTDGVLVTAYPLPAFGIMASDVKDLDIMALGTTTFDTSTLDTTTLDAPAQDKSR